MKKLNIYLCIFAFLFVNLSIAYPITPVTASLAAGSRPSLAIPINEGITSGSMPGPGGIGAIWYSIVLSGNYQMILTMPVDTNFQLWLYDANLNLVDWSYSYVNPENITTTGAVGKFYVAITSVYGNGNYNLNITKFSINGESISSPIIINEGVTSGSLPGPGLNGEIWYYTTLAGNYQLNLTGTGGTNYDLYFYAKNGTLLDSSMTANYPEIITPTNLNGDYFIEVLPVSGSGSFSLNITTLSTPGESILVPLVIGTGLTSGSLPGPGVGGQFWYEVTIGGSKNITLNGDLGTDFDLYLYDNANTLLSSSTKTTYPEVITTSGFDYSNYFIKVDPYLGSGNFNLTISNISIAGSNIQNPIVISQGITTGSFPGAGNSGSIWYNITLNGDYQFSLNGPANSNLDYVLIDSSGAWVDDASNTTYPDVITETNLAGNYILELYGSGSGSFSLNISQITLGNTYTNPKPIKTGTTLGTLPGPEANGGIWYSIKLEGTYEINLSGPGGTDFDLYLYDVNKNLLNSSTTSSYPESIIFFNANSLDTYLIFIDQFSGTGSFSLNVTRKLIPGDDILNPISIGMGSYTGHLPGSVGQFDDWYVIDLPVTDVSVQLTGDAGTDFDLILFDSYYNLVDYSATSSYPENIAISGLQGKHFLVVEQYSGIGNYQLNITDLSKVPGYSPANPVNITEGITYGSLPGPASGGNIWYNVTLNGDFTFNLTADVSTDFDMAIFNGTNGTLIASSQNTYYPEFIEIDNINGPLFILISRYSGSGPFTLDITKLPPIGTDTRPKELSISPANPTITETGTMPGPRPDGGFIYYTWIYGNYSFSLTGEAGTDFDLYLYNSSGIAVMWSNGTSYPETINVLDYYSFYYIGVFPKNSSYNGTYTLTGIRHSIQGDDMNNPIPLNLNANNKVTVIDSLPGYGEAGDKWFSINLNGNFTFILDADSSASFVMQLYNTIDICNLKGF